MKESMTLARAAALFLAIGAMTCLGSIGARAATCSVSATALAFGVYNPFIATPHDTTGTITIACTGTPIVNAVVQLSAGGSGDQRARRMVSGSKILSYQVYTTAARTREWGNGSNSTDTVRESVAANTSVSISMHGRIPARQSAMPGSYADTIIVTVTY